MAVGREVRGTRSQVFGAYGFWVAVLGVKGLSVKGERLNALRRRCVEASRLQRVAVPGSRWAVVKIRAPFGVP